MNKNILFIGPYRQGCSWGIAAKAYIKALVAGGFNVTLRPIYMGSHIDNNIDPFFIALEQNKYDKYDAVIQNVLPHLVDYNASFGKNIALFYTESYNWQNTWPRKLNNMDMIIVPSHSDIYNLVGSGVTTEAHRVPIPIDFERYTKSYPKINGLEEDSFNFYYIGELIERKNLDILLRAFHAEFDRTEKVNLIIKTHKQGFTDKETQELLTIIINEVKSGLRKYANIHMYKQEVVIMGYKSEDIINSLHTSCQCLVAPSSGESWCMPVMDAICFGNHVLVTDRTGPCDIINDDPIYKIDSVAENVNVLQPPIVDLYTGEEQWFRPSINSLREKMRYIYENPQVKVDIDIDRFTYNNIGKRLREII